MVIFGQKIKVVREKGLGQRTGLAGYYDPAKGLIAVDAELKGNEFNQTVLHEFFHAVFIRVGLPQARVSHDAHEMIVENFATAMIENKTHIKKYLK